MLPEIKEVIDIFRGADELLGSVLAKVGVDRYGEVVQDLFEIQCTHCHGWDHSDAPKRLQSTRV